MRSANIGEQQVDVQGSQQNTTSGSSSWQTPPDPEPSIDRVAARAEARDPTCNPDDEVTSQLWDESEGDVLSSAPDETVNTAEIGRKRKRGKRGVNKWPDRTYSVREVGPKGQPLEPFEVRAKFRNAIGFLVRDKLDITISHWDQVPLKMRKDLWKKLKTRFIFARQSRAIAKQYAWKQLGISFRSFRSELTTKYVKKGLDPPKKYKNISANQWKNFVEQKTSAEFLAKSEANSRNAKKNIYSHHLGTGGYDRKIPEWEAEDADRIKNGLPPRFENVEPRGRRWLLARQPKEIEPGCFTWTDPKVDEAAKNNLAVAAKQKEGSFKPSRERDALTVGLGNPEHPGRVRGLSSKLGWKEGFPDYADMYRKCDGYKEALRDRGREEAKQEMSQMLIEIIANPSSELMQKLASVMSAQ